MKKVDIVVGIPAYNEENNIRKLLLSILSQSSQNFNLKQIIIVADSPTDNTVKEIERVRNKKIRLIKNSKRKGQAYGQNIIVKKFTGDILILLNADVLPGEKDFIENLISPLLNNKSVGLVSPKAYPLKEKTFFEKIINYSVKFKDSLYENLREGDNLYLCRGAGRAFSREFAKKIKWPDSLSEDAYSYLLCKKLGYSYAYNPTAVLLFKSPDNFSDHIKQSARFTGGLKIMSKYFDKGWVKQEYKIPNIVLVKNIILYILKNPLFMSTYLGILFYIKIYPNKSEYYKSMWDQSSSSKKLS